MLKRWLLSCVVLTAANGAAHAQLHATGMPAPGAGGSYQPMPRGPAISEPSGFEESHGTQCAWDPSGPSGCFFGGVGVAWLTPVWQRNPATARNSNQGGVNFIGQSDFTWDMRTTPTAFLGYRGADGLGVRGRWWQFDHGTMSTAYANGDALISARPLNVGLAAPIAGGILAESSLGISVFDLEMTHDLTAQNWTLTLGLGGRYAHLNQNYNVYAFQGTGALAGSILSAHNFNGGGPTMSIGARHPIFGNVTFYGVGRSSLLFGPSKQLAFQGDAAGVLTAYRQQNETDVLPVLEMEMGLEYGLQLGQARWFVQGGFQGQVWLGAGSASRSTGLDTFDQSDSNLGLFGVTVRAGVQY